MTCTADRHSTGYAAKRHGCVCPDARAARRAQRGTRVRSPRRPDQTRWIVAERRHTAQRLTQAGLSANDIAVRLGVDQRTVFRYRTQMRQQQAA